MKIFKHVVIKFVIVKKYFNRDSRVIKVFLEFLESEEITRLVVQKENPALLVNIKTCAINTFRIIVILQN